MKYILLLLPILFYSCTSNEKEKEQEKKEIIIQRYDLPFTDKISTVVHVQDHYYCLSRERKLLCLTEKFTMDENISRAVNSFPFDNIKSKGDTLLAGKVVDHYVVYDHYLDGNFKWQKRNVKDQRTRVYEDEKYWVSACCFGQGSGSLFFQDKISLKSWGCKAGSGCVTDVNKMNNEYYFTISSEKEEGKITEVMKISEPTKLYEVTNEEYVSCNWWRNVIDSEESPEEEKRAAMAEGAGIFKKEGILTLISFFHKNQLYHISSNESITFISKMQGDSLALIDTLLRKPIEPQLSRPQDLGGLKMYYFDDAEVNGFLTIRGDTVSLVTTPERNTRNRR